MSVIFLTNEDEVLMYSEQSLTDEQKTQVRENIGAASLEDIESIISSNGSEKFNETGEVVELDVEAETPLSIVSRFHRDTTWELSDKLVLHQVSGNNFVDFTSFLGGAGYTYVKNGMTVTVNDDCTVTLSGTNDSANFVNLINKSHWSGEHSEKIYPAGTYRIPDGFMMTVRAAQYPANNTISGATGNLTDTVTISEPFRILSMIYAVKGNDTIDVTVPLGLFYNSDTVPEIDYEYVGTAYTVTFDRAVYEGEFNWQTGELKDADGNIIGYYDTHEIKSLPGMNYFWTGFGENTISNVSNDLGKIILHLNETAPNETVPSICDFTLTPTTMQAAYGLCNTQFLNGGVFNHREVPLLTTKGTLSVKDVNGNIKYSKYIEPIINKRGVSDLLTEKGLHKEWSKKFYLNALPVETVRSDDFASTMNVTWTWEFTEEDFINTGIPAKLEDIPVASPCFYAEADSQTYINDRVYFDIPYPAKFYYDNDKKKYILIARGVYDSIQYQLTNYSKVHFYYQLEKPYDISDGFAMGITAGDSVAFEEDYSDAQDFIDNGRVYRTSAASKLVTEYNIMPTVAVIVSRNPVDALEGMSNAARMLNADDSAGGDATVQGYSWIGVGDGTTDYTVQIQSKLDELHNTSNGGTIHLGPGTYPIGKSLLVYDNIRIIGDGHTVIEQKADNTHAVIWNGSNIHMRDLTIKLAGSCTELTACIYANANNSSNGNRDERYPENMYVQYCSTTNVKLTGDYKFSWDNEYIYLSNETLAYRGVGVYNSSLYFNYHDCDGLVCTNLYAGIYHGGGSCNYRIYVTESRFAVYGGGGNNIYDIQGHTYYGTGRDGQICATEYVYYGTCSDSDKIMIAFYDTQYVNKGIIYFDGKSSGNRYSIRPFDTGLLSGMTDSWSHNFKPITDHGRGNAIIQPYKENFVGVGHNLKCISGLPYWNTQFNPSIHNAISGAGIWGSITSNKEWTSKGIDLQDVCRYPKDVLQIGLNMPSIICESSPSEGSPIEIIIDISDRPVANYNGFWIQFDHRYVAEEYTVSFDTNNDGVFNSVVGSIRGNDEAVSYCFNYQTPSSMVYGIKISITKALQIPEFYYENAGYTGNTINYNPNGYIGIVNIGIPQNDAYGRVFLGECGGSLYGNVDMHQNTLKNLSNPVDAGDAVSKAYLEQRLAALEALINA